MVNGAYDSATPLKYATAVAKNLAKATLKVAPCKAHGVILGPDLKCSAGILRDSIDGDPAQADITCLCPKPTPRD